MLDYSSRATRRQRVTKFVSFLLLPLEREREKNHTVEAKLAQQPRSIKVNGGELQSVVLLSLLFFQKDKCIRLRSEHRLLLASRNKTLRTLRLYTNTSKSVVGLLRVCSGSPDSDIPEVCRSVGGGGGGGGGGSIGDQSLVFNYRREEKKWSNYIDHTWSLLSDYPRRQRDGGGKKVELETSHSSIQEVD